MENLSNQRQRRAEGEAPIRLARLEGATLAPSYDHCLSLVKSHYENFPVASIAIPKKLRKYVAAVYAFARTADDFADEKEFDGQRMDKLEEWERFLNDPSTQHPVFLALHDTIAKFRIPVQLFSDLLAAFKQDVRVSRYNNFDEVLSYCRNSANPVGRIILHLFGHVSEDNLRYSDAICTALQLANFWQDVSVDLLKDRVYLPKEDLERFGFSYEDLFSKRHDERFEKLMTFQVNRTQDLFNQGRPLITKVPGRLGLELKLTWLGGTKILRKIVKSGYNVLHQRPQLTKADYVGFMFKTLLI